MKNRKIFGHTFWSVDLRFFLRYYNSDSENIRAVLTSYPGCQIPKKRGEGQVGQDRA